MKRLAFLLCIIVCGCYHTDKQTIETLVLANRTLMDAKGMVEADITNTSNLFGRYLANDRRRTIKYYNKAMEAKRLSDAIVNQLQNLKIKLAKEAGDTRDFVDDSITNLDGKDAVAKCNDIMFGGMGEANLLRVALAKYRKEMIKPDDIIDWRDTAYLKIGLLMPECTNIDNGKVNWEEYNFKNKPLVSDIEVLSRLQVDVRNCEALLIRYFLALVSTGEYKYYRPVIYFDRFFGGSDKRIASPMQLDSVIMISSAPPLYASFEMKFIEKGKEIILSSKNCMVTPEMHNEIKKLNKGDKVIIQNVAIVAPDSSIRKYDGPIIYIQ